MAGEDPGDRAQVTRLLSAWRAGDEAARDRVIEAVYAQVRHLAARHLRGQVGPGAVSLQPTELANELFVRLLDSDCTWTDRRHFYNAAALAMRRILVDAARARGSAKRGGGQLHLTLSAAEQQPLPEAAVDQLRRRPGCPAPTRPPQGRRDRDELPARPRPGGDRLGAGGVGRHGRPGPAVRAGLAAAAAGGMSDRVPA